MAREEAARQDKPRPIIAGDVLSTSQERRLRLQATQADNLPREWGGVRYDHATDPVPPEVYDDAMPPAGWARMDGNAIILTLPLPPSVNHYYRRGKGGKVYIGAEGVRFRQVVAYACIQARVKPIGGKLKVAGVFYCGDHRRHDLDNFGKCLLDALQHGGCYGDDFDIDDQHWVRGEILPIGKCVVRVEAATIKAAMGIYHTPDEILNVINPPYDLRTKGTK
jgi:crossover junction endodeoxyribonuclease RusA